jgi:hypothetical protein
MFLPPFHMAREKIQSPDQSRRISSKKGLGISASFFENFMIEGRLLKQSQLTFLTPIEETLEEDFLECFLELLSRLALYCQTLL